MYRKLQLIEVTWQNLSKKKKKKIKKKLKRLDIKLSSKPTIRKVKNKIKHVKPPTTTVFYTDDKEWEEHIKAVLSK